MFRTETCSMNIRSKQRYRVIFCAVQGLRGMNIIYWVKLRCTNFLWEKKGCMYADAYEAPPHTFQSLKVRTFSSINHLHSTWVACSC